MLTRVRMPSPADHRPRRFYFIFHTRFVDAASGELRVPLAMMDKAFKNKGGRYLRAGVARLAFTTVGVEQAAE